MPPKLENNNFERQEIIRCLVLLAFASFVKHFYIFNRLFYIFFYEFKMLSSMDYPDNRNVEEINKNIKNLNLKEPKGKVSMFARNLLASTLNLCLWSGIA